jgi:hypothetical protein
MQILTFATHTSGYMPALLESAARNGFDVMQVGTGEPWLGFLQRFSFYMHALQRFAPNQIVVISDAYDVIVLGDARECEMKYHAMCPGRQVLIAAYRGNFVTRQLYGRLESPSDNDNNSPYNSPSAGLFMGHADALLKLLKSFCAFVDCSSRLDRDDQQLLTTFFRDHCRDCAYLDTSCQIFYELDFNGSSLVSSYAEVLLGPRPPASLNGDHYHWSETDARVIVKHSHQRPIFLHGNGNMNLDTFVDVLDLPAKVPREYSDNIFHHVKGIAVKLLSLTAWLAHLAIIYLLYVHIFFTKSPRFLYVVVLLNICIVTQWFIFGHCLLTPFENMLLGKKNHEEGKSSQSAWISGLTIIVPNERVIWYALTLTPILSTLICIWRLDRLTHGRRLAW